MPTYPAKWKRCGWSHKAFALTNEHRCRGDCHTIPETDKADSQPDGEGTVLA